MENCPTRYLIVAAICAAFAPVTDGGHIPIILPTFVALPSLLFSRGAFDWLMLWPATITFIIVAGFGFLPETGTLILTGNKWPNSTDKE
jgi:hypothetical protein